MENDRKEMGMEAGRYLYRSPLGPMVAECEGGTLVGLRFVDEGAVAEPLPDGEVRRWLDRYFSGQAPEETPRLLLRGTEFQRRVWRALLEVPYGRTVGYADLGRRVGCRSARAVGRAVGGNPVAVVVPCHRVVGADGSLTGYAYGLDRKRALLSLEWRQVR